MTDPSMITSENLIAARDVAIRTLTTQYDEQKLGTSDMSPLQQEVRDHDLKGAIVTLKDVAGVITHGMKPDDTISSDTLIKSLARWKPNPDNYEDGQFAIFRDYQILFTQFLKALDIENQFIEYTRSNNSSRAIHPQ